MFVSPLNPPKGEVVWMFGVCGLALENVEYYKALILEKEIDKIN
jgi:hypothetical protein